MKGAAPQSLERNVRGGSVGQRKSRASMALVVALAAMLSGVARAEVPAMPVVTAVPPSSRPPLSSATRATDPGTEYVDLVRLGYVEEEYYLSGVAPAITGHGRRLFDVP